jgi:hypothetical protein
MTATGSGWDTAIADLEEILDAIELALETDEWDPRSFDVAVGSEPLGGEPTDEQRRRSAALVAEVDDARRRLGERMRSIQVELGDGDRRRTAANRYARANRLT